VISKELIEEVTLNILRLAETSLPNDIVTALEQAHQNETENLAKTQLQNILENISMAKENKIPMCQDTGVPIFFVKLPATSGFVVIPEISKGITNGVIKATEQVPLRPNTVHPLTRANPGNNTGEQMPYINFEPSDNEFVEIFVMPKGAGSENMSALKMLTPAQGIKGIKEFVLETLVHAGGKPCPPIILGIGIGGSAIITTD
jgi:fumarate hydratase subunit alpha